MLLSDRWGMGMRWRRGKLCILMPAMALGLSGSVAFPQQTAPARGLYISGFVRDADTNELISAVTLELQRSSGESASPPVVSGTRGEFQFNGVSSGDYVVFSHAKGYESTALALSFVNVSLSNVTVIMHRSSSGQPAAPGDTISAHELSIPERAREEFDKGVKQMTAAKPDYRRALSHFESAIKEFPDYYEAYAQVGVAQHHVGDKVAAEVALRKSAELSSGHYLDALLLLAEMLNDAGRFQEAESFARKCATQDESASGCDLELARSLAGLKHLSEAEAMASKASQLNPNNAATFLVLGNIHIKEHKYAAVVEDFDAYLKLKPAGPESDQVRAVEEQARRALARTETVPSSPSKQ
jgi:Tfp pilus assembly protein PilF